MPQKPKKIPNGTKKSPWYLVPEHTEHGKLIPAHFVRLTATGVWKEANLPSTAIIKRDTSY